MAFLIGAVNLSQQRADLVLVYMAFLVYVMTLSIPLILYRSHWGWFHPLIIVVLWWGLVRDVFPRLEIYALGLDFHRVVSDTSAERINSLVTEAILLNSLGFLVLYTGFFSPGEWPVPRLVFHTRRYLSVKVWIVAAVSIIAFVVLVSEAGNLDRLMLQRGLSSDMRIEAELGGHWHFMVGLLETACLLWLALQPHVWKKPAFLALLALALFMGFAATGSRSGVVLPVVSATVIWALHYRRFPYGWALIIGVFGIAVIGILGEFRVQSRGAQALADAQLESGLVGSIEGGLETIISYAGEVDGLYGILAKVPEEVDLLYGKSYLSIPAAPIPRAIWPDKPEAGDKLNATYIFGNPVTAIPPGNIGEAYWNFHVPGVVIVMFLFGRVLKWFVRLYVINGGAGWVVAIYVVSIFSLQPNSSSFYDWLHAIVPIVFFLLFFCGWPRKVKKCVGEGAGLSPGSHY